MNNFKLSSYLALIIGLNTIGQNLNDIEIYNTANSGINYNQINSIEFENPNRLWVGTSNGLSIFDLSTNIWYNFNTSITTPPWCCLDNENVTAVEWAEEINTMFIGTNNGILGFFSEDGEINYDSTNWTTSIGSSCSANNNIINSILYDDGIWSGSTDGLCIENLGGEGEWLLQNTQTGFYSNHFKSIIKNPNTDLIAIGTMNGGLITYDGEFNNYYSSNSGILDNSVLDVTFDQNNNIIITTPQAGLGILTENNSWVWLNNLNSNIASNSLKNVTVDINNNLWITTLENGLSHYINNTFYNYNTSNSNLPDNKINCLLFDENNNLWLGTDSSGLIKINNPTMNTINETNSMNNIDATITQELIKIHLNQKATYEILNQNGQLINNGILSEGDNVVTISHYSSGFYILKIKNNQSLCIKKLIKN
mgnify:CR=1 FL=1